MTDSNPFDFWVTLHQHQKLYERRLFEAQTASFWKFSRRRDLLKQAELHLQAVRRMLKTTMSQHFTDIEGYNHFIGKLEAEIYRKP